MAVAVAVAVAAIAVAIAAVVVIVVVVVVEVEVVVAAAADEVGLVGPLQLEIRSFAHRFMEVHQSRKYGFGA